ncbi:MAG: GNAT family N-acetyltransferase [Rickettsiales bacterium]|jgi:ABC-type Zn uptake system ZnuABC Zn-binding protein ZnuA|nr:GNAT family N-acetyltransferase [Rickettsiales bacterium]
MKDRIKIRFAGPDDLNELTDLFVLFKEYFRALDGKDKIKPPIAAYKAQIKSLNFSTKPILRTLVAEQGGRLVGAISFSKGWNCDFGTHYDLPYFFIQKEFRGSRAALLFFAAIKKLAKKEKIASLVFSVYGPNKSAAKLYEHIGAKYWADKDEHFMYLKLGG